MSKEELKKTVKGLIETVEQRFGKGALMALGSTPRERIASISTGSLSLDSALGIGGYPRGRIVEVYGPESSGKTTLCLHAIHQTQRASGVAAFIDAEHAFDPTYAQAIGVDLKHLLLSQPDNGEQALEIAEMLTRSEAVRLIVVDSVAALTPKAEIEGEMGDSHMGLQARLMSQALRKLTAVCHKTDTTLMFINQLRQKIGVVFGSPETTPGGNALKYYASVRLDVRRIGQVKNDAGAIGSRTRVRVVKNKCAPPFREAEFDIRWGHGIDSAGDLIDHAVECGVIDKRGAFLAFGNEKLGQGRERAREVVLGTDALALAIRDAVVALGAKPAVPPNGAAHAEAPAQA
jgi:recombination protein RecA